MVPVLTIVLAFGMREAAGTSLIVMSLAAIGGLLARVGNTPPIDWGVVVAFMLGSMSGAVIGGPLSSRAKPYQLTLTFGALLAVVCIASLSATLLTLFA